MIEVMLCLSSSNLYFFSLQHLCLLDTGSNPRHQVERILCTAFEDDIAWSTIQPMTLPSPSGCFERAVYH